ncbi:PF06945 family protein [Leptospira broomii serovar Hurstbridge str. 5399]|uniref:PF06945 family protein n=1 Tax=Leptospira broomii serovar Hurstbridge str. 5399 TaxID=1049789 RepID=T0GBS8_9LEPT|nr:PF06945 family protein [Leptospira broomii serovar Hurstbridge str. 5399]
MIVRSPCIKLCQMDPMTGLCEGCFRTLQEIGMWTSYSEEERKRIRIELQKRKESISSSNAS